MRNHRPPTTELSREESKILWLYSFGCINLLYFLLSNSTTMKTLMVVEFYSKAAKILKIFKSNEQAQRIFQANLIENTWAIYYKITHVQKSVKLAMSLIIYSHNLIGFPFIILIGKQISHRCKDDFKPCKLLSKTKSSRF